MHIIDQIKRGDYLRYMGKMFVRGQLIISPPPYRCAATAIELDDAAYYRVYHACSDLTQVLITSLDIDAISVDEEPCAVLVDYSNVDCIVATEAAWTAIKQLAPLAPDNKHALGMDIHDILVELASFSGVQLAPDVRVNAESASVFAFSLDEPIKVCYVRSRKTGRRCGLLLTDDYTEYWDDDEEDEDEYEEEEDDDKDA